MHSEPLQTQMLKMGYIKKACELLYDEHTDVQQAAVDLIAVMAKRGAFHIIIMRMRIT